MPLIRKKIERRGRVLAAATVAALVALAAPAHAAGVANPYDCAPEPTLTRSFLLWGDLNLYTPVANAGVENGSADWTLTGAAAVVSGNEPWKIGGLTDSHSLDLPAGSSATTAPLCIDETYPHFRLFVRNTGALASALRIEVLYFDGKGNLVNTKPYDYKSASVRWQVTGMVGINVFTPKTTITAAPIAFRFTPAAKDAHFQIDDVYVDPRSRY